MNLPYFIREISITFLQGVFLSYLLRLSRASQFRVFRCFGTFNTFGTLKREGEEKEENNTATGTQTRDEILTMVYLLFLLLALPFSLAVPQVAVGTRSSIGTSISVATGAALVSIGSATTAKGVTTATKRATTTTRRATTTTKRATRTTRPKSTTTRKGIPTPAEVDCSDSSWEPTVDAWMKEKVDEKLKEWWESISNRTSGNFVAEFGKAFGDSEHNLACGVDTEDQCVNPSCKGLFYTLFLSPILGYLF